MRNKLINAGYKEFNQNSIISSAEIGYQKRFRDENGDTKYFITWDEYEPILHFKGKGYEIHLQFEKEFKGRKYTVNMTIFSFFDYDSEKEQRVYDNVSVTDIEEMIEEIWKKNNFEYYEKE